MKILKNRLFIFIIEEIIFSSITALAVSTITADQIEYEINSQTDGNGFVSIAIEAYS